MSSKKNFPTVFFADDGTSAFYVKNEKTAYWISFSPMTRPMPGEEGWPITSISKISGVKSVAKDLKHATDPSDYNRKLSPKDKEDMWLEPMEEAPRADDYIRYQGIVDKYGENYSRSKDYERVFGKQKAKA